MYEIWLGINIIYEWCLLYPLVPLVMFGSFFGAYLSTMRLNKNWQAAFRPALVWAIVAFIVLFFVYPMLIKSSIKEVNYLVDWLNHLGICAGLAGFVGLVVWPIIAARKAKHYQLG